MKKLTISLTGHRPPKLAGYNIGSPYYKRMQEYLEGLIEKAILRCDTLELHSGMALGADTVWAQAIVAKKNKVSRQNHFRGRHTQHGTTITLAKTITRRVGRFNQSGGCGQHVCTKQPWKILWVHIKPKKYWYGGCV